MKADTAIIASNNPAVTKPNLGETASVRDAAALGPPVTGALNPNRLAPRDTIPNPDATNLSPFTLTLPPFHLDVPFHLI